jgi:hypothetical protein
MSGVLRPAASPEYHHFNPLDNVLIVDESIHNNGIGTSVYNEVSRGSLLTWKNP